MNGKSGHKALFGCGALVLITLMAPTSVRCEILGTDLYGFCEAQQGSHEQDVCLAFILGVLKGVDYSGTARSAAGKPCFGQYVPPEQAELIVRKLCVIIQSNWDMTLVWSLRSHC